MNKKLLTELFALALVSGMAAEAVGPTVVVTPAYVNQLAEEMRTNHPALQAAAARVAAASAGLAGVRRWEDPMIRLGGMGAEKMMRAEDGDLIYGAEQKLPLWGKPALARRVARAEVDVERSEADYQFQSLRSTLAKAAFQTALAEYEVAVGQQDLDFVQTIADATDAKFRSGAATQLEMLLVGNERARRLTQLQTDRAKLAHDRLALSRLLNRELQTNWPSLELPPLAAPVSYSERLVRLAAQYEPRLRTLREQAKQAQAMAAATRRTRLPDVSVGVESRNYSGNGEWRQAEVMVSFNLPWFNRSKYAADVRRDEAKVRATEFEVADYALAVREEIHGLTVKIDAARREGTVYRDEIIPRSESALDSARAAWESGRGSFRDVLDARRMLLEGRLMYARAVSEQYQMLSELVLCCGLGDLEALQMIGAVPEERTEKPNP